MWVQAKHVVKTPGCTPEERKSFGDWLKSGQRALAMGLMSSIYLQATSTRSATSTDLQMAHLPTGAPALRLRNIIENDTCMAKRRDRARAVNKGLRLDYFVASQSITQPKSHPL